MEKWFERAMLADPECYDACWTKLTYLFPKWYGSEKEALEFARWCVAEGSGKSRIPTLMLAAHEEFCARSGDEAAYMLKGDVWDDVERACTKLVRDAEASLDEEQLRHDRAKYLQYAVACKRWREFLALTQEFGDAIDVKFLGGKDLYKYYKKQAEKEIAKRAG